MSFLGIDVGTGGEATRALVIDEAGRVVASATEEHPATLNHRKSAGRSRIPVTGGAHVA